MITVTLKGKEFPILFDLSAAEAIQKRYGGIDELGEKLKDFGEVKWILCTIINEGIALKNYEQDTHEKFITEDQVGMLASLKDLQNATLTNAILEAFYDSFGTPEQTDDLKNKIAAEIAQAQSR